VKTRMHLGLLQKAQEKTSIVEMLERAKETCEYCRPLTPITCVTTCNIWKLKNELRKLHEKTKNPNFMTKMLNVLKNKRRVQTLEILSNGRYSMVRLRQKLKKLGYYHSRRTIAEEYVNPLIEVGLVKKNNKYRTTLFGCKLNELIKDFSAIGELLPPHSECYEEKAIEALSESAKTYEELKSTIPAESLSRVLKRLQEANLITKDNENSYVFYFKTKRKPKHEKLSPTEKSVYENIPQEGITAKKLTDKTNISLRRTYKYLRKLRGKKLTFKRKRPKTYALTRGGRQIAELLEKMHLLLIKLEQTSAEFTTQHLEPEIQQIPVPDIAENRREKPPQILIRSSV